MNRLAVLESDDSSDSEVTNYPSAGENAAYGCADADLVAMAQRQLPYVTQAFDALVNRHYERTVRLAEGIVGSHDEAESIAQDAMMRMYAHIKTFRGDAKFTTWLYRITENLCCSYLSRERRELEKRKNAARERDALGVGDGVGVDATGFEKLVAGLSAEDRTLLALRFINDLELQEIAKVMGLGLSAMKMRYYRLLARLRCNFDGTLGC